MQALAWFLTILGSLAGGFALFGSFLEKNAPAQGALAAIAVALVVLPYCFARAISELARLFAREAAAALPARSGKDDLTLG